jgi:anti-sigma B factor antagonist
MNISETGPGRYSISGEIDAHSAPSFAEAVARTSVERLVVDMSAVSFMDSSGLRVLVEVQQRSLDGGPSLTIVDPSHSVVRLLELAGLDEQFDIGSA